MISPETWEGARGGGKGARKIELLSTSLLGAVCPGIWTTCAYHHQADESCGLLLWSIRALASHDLKGL